MQQPDEPAMQWRSLKWPDGSRYEGVVKVRKQHGLGVMAFPNKDRYEGQWSDGVMDGYGVYIWSNGTIYRGDWVQGHMHGCGVRMFKTPDGQVKALEGKFFADEYVGPIVPCSQQDCLDAAVEADVAALQARNYQALQATSAATTGSRAAWPQAMTYQQPPITGGGSSSSSSMRPPGLQKPVQGLVPGLADPVAEQKLSSLVQQLAESHAQQFKQQQKRQAIG